MTVGICYTYGSSDQMQSFVAQKSTNLHCENEQHGNMFPNRDQKNSGYVNHILLVCFLSKKKNTKLLQQISGPHSTCEEVVVGTVAISSSTILPLSPHCK